MNTSKEESVYEQKLDTITVLLEKLVLDAMIAVLQKIEKRNRECLNASTQLQTDDMTF